jgi:hypothetical protein
MNRIMNYITYHTKTLVEPKDLLIQSEYGEITYQDWCVREILRIRKGGGSADLYEEGNYCAVR